MPGRLMDEADTLVDGKFFECQLEDVRRMYKVDDLTAAGTQQRCLSPTKSDDVADLLRHRVTPGRHRQRLGGRSRATEEGFPVDDRNNTRIIYVGG